ncbi:hypothetical protein KC347_g64 [Hortaea werneckii]|nr:hypothetical protein KC347_g64 [Hortaea werneckii]
MEYFPTFFLMATNCERCPDADVQHALPLALLRPETSRIEDLQHLNKCRQAVVRHKVILLAARMGPRSPQPRWVCRLSSSQAALKVSINRPRKTIFLSRKASDLSKAQGSDHSTFITFTSAFICRQRLSIILLFPTHCFFPLDFQPLLL